MLVDLVKKVQKIESREKLTKQPSLQDKIDKYNSLKKRGLIEDDKYTIPRHDIIGYSKYGHTVN